MDYKTKQKKKKSRLKANVNHEDVTLSCSSLLKKKGQVFEPFLDLMTCKTKVKDSESTSYPVTCGVALAEQR